MVKGRGGRKENLLDYLSENVSKAIRSACARALAGFKFKKKTGIGEHAELSDKVIYSHNFVYNDEERLILRAVS